MPRLWKMSSKSSEEEFGADFSLALCRSDRRQSDILLIIERLEFPLSSKSTFFLSGLLQPLGPGSTVVVTVILCGDNVGIEDRSESISDGIEWKD
jgi:hypothetical protein